jgi:hypothetical protein
VQRGCAFVAVTAIMAAGGWAAGGGWGGGRAGGGWAAGGRRRHVARGCAMGDKGRDALADGG